MVGSRVRCCRLASSTAHKVGVNTPRGSSPRLLIVILRVLKKEGILSYFARCVLVLVLLENKPTRPIPGGFLNRSIFQRANRLLRLLAIHQLATKGGGDCYYLFHTSTLQLAVVHRTQLGHYHARNTARRRRRRRRSCSDQHHYHTHKTIYLVLLPITGWKQNSLPYVCIAICRHTKYHRTTYHTYI